jgi:hypothetical protein
MDAAEFSNVSNETLGVNTGECEAVVDVVESVEGRSLGVGRDSGGDDVVEEEGLPGREVERCLIAERKGADKPVP